MSYYNSIEEIPPDVLESGGTFRVRTSNLHPDLIKRRKGAVGVVYQAEGGGPGPMPQGPWLPLIILAIKLLLVSAFIVVVATAITTTITTITSDPVDVIGRDSKGNPTLLRTKRGRILTIGYDEDGSAYISGESDPTGPLGFDMWLLIPIGIITIIIIVMLVYWSKSRKGEPEKEKEPKKEPEDKTNESED